ncbi:beta-lactamase family protein [Arenibacter sp. BSSL-BM3]|uniref:Beta-lactamase family protein n=1 Tax=Arenibacter arenosicollis TaxID=2762274 RepID=A0ABR7QP93_9FLAO|nr:serine hydrolase domain-containing protein [Arenibacter arenosicollis]MBC8768986.1 beta-lactamase family protein [Arenibacter arenosicollis]
MKNIYRLPTFLILLLFLAGPVHGQSASKALPNVTISGVDKERLSRYDDFLKNEIDEGRIPGAVSYIMRRGEIVHEVAYGYRSYNDKTPIQQNQLFHIMSMTKPIVTAAFMMLYEEGYFSLTDPVSKYLPQLKNLKVAMDVNQGANGETEPANKEITISHLLTHTAGFSHGLGGTKLDNEIAKALYSQPHKDIEGRVNAMMKLPLIGHPGEQWYYSASPDVLALLIEHFTGSTTAEFLKERIFDPLEMNDTGYNISKKNKDRWMPVHNLDKEGNLVNSAAQLPIEGNTIYGGTHGLFSSALDYMKFCQMLLNKGEFKGKHLLSPKTVDIMTMNQIGDLYEAPGQGFGLGFGVTTDVAASKSLGSIGQYYWSGAYCTYFFIDPKEELIVILMSQLQPYSNYYGEKMRQMVYQSLITEY